MVKILKTLALIVVFSLSARASLADTYVTDLDRTITKTGAQGNAAYIFVTPAPSYACTYGALYIFDTSTSSGKAFYATLLTAQSSTKILSRVDYTVLPNGTCSIALIEM